jgi:mevalonate pyrophosphate decarboxylase
MSSVKTKTVIQRVIEETGYAFKVTCETENSNADYAEFASSQALPSFQEALNDPGLTYEQLCQILRRASNKAVRRQCKTPWPLFMASHVEKLSNSNKVG